MSKLISGRRVGLAVCRIQPMHEGHRLIFDRMIGACETAILAIGSTNRKRELSNPWTFEERKEMVQNVYGDRIKIVPLQDLGTEQGTNDWVNYVLDKVHKLNLPEPTDYFTGSRADAVWYRNFFFDGTASEIADIAKKGWAEAEQYRTQDGSWKLLHSLERANNSIPAATDLRVFLQTRTDGWKKWVPAVNHKLVEETFPEELKVRI